MNNKKLIDCECGLEINYYNRKSHYNSKRHKNRLETPNLFLKEKKIKTNEEMIEIIQERKLRKRLTTEIWKINNEVKWKEYQKRYYQKNKEKIIERTKLWNLKNNLKKNVS